jgi:4-aminobutyrate aminotransferase-like enzyme
MSKTSQTIQLLREYESRNVLFTEPDGSWPIVWERANGIHVWDAEGKKYLDLTAAFGVAAAGHANPNIVKAGQKQMAKLLHAMGDVHPHALKAELACELSRITFERWTNPSELKTKNSKFKTGKVIFSNSGFEAVESALKTAMLATGKRGVIHLKAHITASATARSMPRIANISAARFNHNCASLATLLCSQKNPPTSPPSNSRSVTYSGASASARF